MIHKVKTISVIQFMEAVIKSLVKDELHTPTTVIYELSPSMPTTFKGTEGDHRLDPKLTYGQRVVCQYIYELNSFILQPLEVWIETNSHKQIIDQLCAIRNWLELRDEL